MDDDHRDHSDHRADDEHGAQHAETGELVEELLIEEISIDGMCGVY